MIHRAARIQAAAFRGQHLRADSPQGRFDEGAAVLDGRRLNAVEAYGKHLFYEFEGPVWLHVHLGLFGKFRLGRGVAPPARGAVRLRFRGDAGWLTLSGPTACDIIDALDRKRILARIGPDPLRAEARPGRAVERILGSGSPVGALLLDQSVIGGIGNVYRAELAFRAGIAPTTPGRLLTREVVLAMWRDARTLMREGERSGRIITTRPADRPHPTGSVRAAERYYVYGRAGKPCLVCDETIAGTALAGRSMNFCPVCQPAPIPSSESSAGIRERKLKKPRVAAGHAATS